MENLLEVKNLQFSFRTYGGVVKAVRDVSFEVRPGKILGIGQGQTCQRCVILPSQRRGACDCWRIRMWKECYLSVSDETESGTAWIL